MTPRVEKAIDAILMTMPITGPLKTLVRRLLVELVEAVLEAKNEAP
jgi:hypothetical protein